MVSPVGRDGKTKQTSANYSIHKIDEGTIVESNPYKDAKESKTTTIVEQTTRVLSEDRKNYTKINNMQSN